MLPGMSADIGGIQQFALLIHQLKQLVLIGAGRCAQIVDLLLQGSAFFREGLIF